MNNVNSRTMLSFLNTCLTEKRLAHMSGKLFSVMLFPHLENVIKIGLYQNKNILKSANRHFLNRETPISFGSWSGTEAVNTRCSCMYKLNADNITIINIVG